MISFVIGGSGSGKSAFAEQIFAQRNKKYSYYLATMKIYGEEGRKKVKRHRDMRKEKGFLTLECPVDIEQALLQIPKKDTAILLECMSNLVANEMFLEDRILLKEELVSKVIKEVEALSKEVEDFVIVSNNIFEDGNSYDASTLQYMQALAEINTYLVEMADEAYEVVVGIPIRLK